MELQAARARLKERVIAIVGEGDIPRFDEALTHPSFANESSEPDNQRLEFLGDAVLGLCVSELLTRERPEADEGVLTRMRSALVNAETFGFSLRARGGRTVKPEMPTMRRSSPSAYSTSVGSSVRHTMRWGKPSGIVSIRTL